MKTVVATDKAPAALGPYSQAIVAHGRKMLFCSGQIGLDPATGQLVSPDVAGQTRRALDNLGAVLAEGGAGFDRVVKTTIFLTDINDFATVNEVYSGYFKENPPARSTVAVAGLPKGARVEVEALAVIE